MKRHPEEQITYGLFDTPTDLEKAYEKLVRAGFLPEDMSLLMSENTHETDFAPLYRTKAAEGVTAGGLLGASLGGILGGLVALGATTGVGVLVVGPALAFGAAGGLIGGLMAHELPEDEAQRAHDAIHEGKVMLAVHTHKPSEVDLARRLFEAFHGEQIELVA